MLTPKMGGLLTIIPLVPEIRTRKAQGCVRAVEPTGTVCSFSSKKYLPGHSQTMGGDPRRNSRRCGTFFWPISRWFMMVNHVYPVKTCVSFSIATLNNQRVSIGGTVYESFLKWWIPKSPLISILKWSKDLDDLGVPQWLRKLPYRWIGGFDQQVEHFSFRVGIECPWLKLRNLNPWINNKQPSG